MDLKDVIKKQLRESYGDFSTYLESKYEETVIDKLYVEGLDRRLSSDQIQIRRAWFTYNQVILEFKHNLKNMLKVKELQYRLTNEEDPNSVCIEIIEDFKSQSPELNRLYEKIRNFG